MCRNVLEIPSIKFYTVRIEMEKLLNEQRKNIMNREKEIIEKSKKTYNRGMIISVLVNLMNIGLIF